MRLGRRLKLEGELRSKLSAKSWIIFDQIRKCVLFEKGSSMKREMASLTKIMTCLLTLEIFEEFDLDISTFKVIVTRRAAAINGTSA
jgi:D-alanyl-D-alanine carboxypeptidase